jgi:hypothetical protein
MSRKRRGPLFDVHPVTGANIEIFFTDRTLESFGRRGAGWFWWPRRRGFAPEGKAVGPFPTSYSAYRDAFVAISRNAGKTEPATTFGGMRSPHFILEKS